MTSSGKFIQSFITWQGEGPDVGKRMLLLRTKVCNKSCSFCDTMIIMRVSQEYSMDFSDIQKQLTKNNLGLMLTGGEPTLDLYLQQTADLLNELTYPVANVETNGYKLNFLMDMVDKSKNVKYIYSPKFLDEGELDLYIAKSFINKRYKDDRIYIKLVINENSKMIKETIDFLDSIKYDFDMYNVYLMPEGKTYEELKTNSSYVFDLAEKYKCQFSSREHIVYDFI